MIQTKRNLGMGFDNSDNSEDHKNNVKSKINIPYSKMKHYGIYHSLSRKLKLRGNEKAVLYNIDDFCKSPRFHHTFTNHDFPCMVKTAFKCSDTLLQSRLLVQYHSIFLVCFLSSISLMMLLGKCFGFKIFS